MAVKTPLTELLQKQVPEAEAAATRLGGHVPPEPEGPPGTPRGLSPVQALPLATYFHMSTQVPALPSSGPKGQAGGAQSRARPQPTCFWAWLGG